MHLGPVDVARWLEGADPLAATLLRRAMVEDTLAGAKSKRYRHAARHLAECRSLVPLIGDFGRFETHDGFVARLRAKHGRKTGFWPLVAEAAGTGTGRHSSPAPVGQDGNPPTPRR